MTSLPLLREAVAKMTEGPWRVEFHDQGCDIYGKQDATGLMVADTADAYGIVALRNAAPALLDEVEAARAGLAAVLAEREAFDQRWEQLHMFIVNLPSSQYTVDAVAYYMRQLEREVL